MRNLFQRKTSVWFNAILQHSKWLLLGDFIAKAVALFLLPVYTRYLTPSDYGILNSLEVIANLLPLFFSLSLPLAFGRFYHDDSKNIIYLQRLFSTIFWFVLGSGLCLIPIFILSSYFWLPNFVNVDIFPYAYIAFIPVLFTQLTLIGTSFFRQSLEVKKITLITVVGMLLNVSISLYLLIIADLGVLARLIGTSISVLIAFAIILFYIRKRKLLAFVFDWSLFKACLKYAAPMIPMVAASWISSVSDRLVIGKYVDMEAVGLYSIAFNISMVLYFLGDAITKVIAPVAMSGLINDKEKTKQKISEYSFFLWIFMLYASIFLFFFSENFVQIFLDKSFYETYRIIPILATATVFGMQYRLYAQIISFYKKTHIFTITAISSALFNLLLNFLFVPLFGYLAAVWSTLLTSIFYASVIIIASRRLEYIPLSIAKYLATGLVYLLYLAFAYSDFATLFWKILVFALLTIVIARILFKKIFLDTLKE